MDNLEEGMVVICSTSQAGTITQIIGNDSWVLLTNGDIWVGQLHDLRLPQNEEDLAACPLNVDRLEKKFVRSNRE
jgi:hypothetical protein